MTFRVFFPLVLGFLSFVFGAPIQAQIVGGEAVDPPNRSILDSGPEGLRAFVSLLERQGLDYVLWEQPLVPEFVDEFPLLIIPAPLDALGQTEVQTIYRFVQNGGRVLYFPSFVPGPALGASDPLLNSFGLSLPEAARTIGPDGQINRYPMELVPIYESAIPQGPVVVRGGRRLKWQGRPADVFHVLLEDEWGMGAVAVAHGSGMFVAVSDLSPMANRWLAEGASAGFLIGVIRSYLGSGPVGIDIYHHGMQRSQDPWAWLFQSPYGPLLIHALVLGAMALWFYGHRRWPMITPDIPSQGTAVAELAGQYRWRGEPTLVASHLIRRCAEGVLRGGDFMGLDNKALLGAIASHYEVPPQPLLKSLERVESGEGEGALWALFQHLEGLGAL